MFECAFLRLYVWFDFYFEWISSFGITYALRIISTRKRSVKCVSEREVWRLLPCWIFECVSAPHKFISFYLRLLRGSKQPKLPPTTRATPNKLFEFQTKNRCMQEFPSMFFPEKNVIYANGLWRFKTNNYLPSHANTWTFVVNAWINKYVRLCDWNLEWNAYSFTLTVIKIHIFNLNSEFMV